MWLRDLLNEPSDGVILREFEREKEEAKRIGYFTDTPATEWLGWHYMRLVEDEAIPTTKEIKQAVKYFKWRYNNQNSFTWAYSWDEAAAMRFVMTMEQSLQIGGEPLVLQPHQHFRLCQMFGWVGKNGNRGLSEYFDIMGRGNGKSTEKAMVILYDMLLTDSKTYHATMFAGTEDDATDIFITALALLADSKPMFGDRFHATATEIRMNTKYERTVIDKRGRKVIERPYKDSKKVRFDIASSTESHGKAVNILFVDELHTLDRNKMWAQSIDTLIRSQVKVKNPFIMYSSTRSSTVSQMLESKIESSASILNNLDKEIRDPDKFAFLYYQEAGDNLFDIKTWLKSNPNLFCKGNPLKMVKDFLEYTRNRDSANADSFFTQEFNMLDITERTSWISTQRIRENHDTFNRDDLKGKRAYIGFDLSGGGNDFSAVYVIIPDRKDDKNVLYIEGKSFITDKIYRDKIMKTEYYEDMPQWLRDGTLVITEHTNGVELEDYIIELIEFYDVVKIVYDQAYAGRVVKMVTERVGEEHMPPMKSLRQNGHTYSEPIIEIRQLFAEHSVNFNNDSLITYYLSNAEAIRPGKRQDMGQEYVLSKPQSRPGDKDEYKIDGAAAIAMAYSPFIEDGAFRGLEEGVVGFGKVETEQATEDITKFLELLRGGE